MLDLFPHQEEAVEKLSNGKILYGGVGTGKSRTAVAYYLRKQAPKDVYVITTAKKRDSLDWETEFARAKVFKGMRNEDVGQLWVDSWNNITKYKNVKGAFFIFDEQRLVGSGAWAKTFEFIAKHGNEWILLSATPGDTWLDYMSVFIANGFYRNRTEFKEEHVVYDNFAKFPKVKSYKNVGILLRHRHNLLVHMPYQKHTTRVMKYVHVEYDQELVEKVTKSRWNPFLDRPIRSQAEYFYAIRRIIYSHPSRLEAVREKIKEFPRIIIFYSFDYELEKLRTLSDQVTVAEWNGHKKQEVPDAESWVYLVQYVSGAEAWECTSTNVTLYYSLQYSYRIWEQTQGRVDRLDTMFSILKYFVLISKAPIDGGVMNALSHKHSFNESYFAQNGR